MQEFFFQNIDYLCVPGSATSPCEDLVHVNEDWLLLMDGASPLAPSSMEPSDAAWFVREADRLLSSRIHLPLMEALRDSMKLIRRSWKGTSENMPSSGIVFLRLVQGDLQYLLLGDCTLSLELVDGSFFTVEDDALCRLDRIALAELQDHAAKFGKFPRECLPFIQETLRRHRDLRNTPDGYYILDPSGRGLPYSKTGSIPARKIRSVFLTTDGFSQLREFTGESFSSIHKRAKKEGLSSLLGELHHMQEQDSSFDRLPRFKFRDDATSIIAKVMRKGDLV